MKSLTKKFIVLYLSGLLGLTACNHNAASSSPDTSSKNEASSIVTTSSTENSSLLSSIESSTLDSSFDDSSSAENSSSGQKEITNAIYNYNITIDHTNSEDTMTIDSNIDLTNFLSYDNTVYHNDLARFGLLFGANLYDETKLTINGNSYEADNYEALVDYFGFSDYQMVSLSGDNYTYDQRDTASFQMAKQTIKGTDGKNKDLILLAIAGTANEDEWISDFDLGSQTNYFTMTGQHPEYTDFNYHKGFYVAYQRTLTYVEKYLSNINDDNDKVLFITGHSRGGGLSNMMGKHFEEDTDYKTFTYTFASPRITTLTGEYKTIFNIVNKQDFVTALAPEYIGFKRFGTDVSVDPAKFSSTYKEETSLKYSAVDMEKIIAAFETLVPDMESCYLIKEDEDHELFPTMEKGPYQTEEEAQKIVDKNMTYISAFSSCYYSIKIVQETDGYHIKAYAAPALVLEVLASMAAKASDLGAAAVVMIKAMVIFNETQLALISTFVRNATGIGNNHHYFTYFAALNHMDVNSSAVQ